MFSPLLVVVVATLTVTLVLLMIASSRRAAKCPRCSATPPGIRIPAGLRQLLWGGWKCPACGCPVDRRGREVTE
jgi:hypothetical protein